MRRVVGLEHSTQQQRGRRLVAAGAQAKSIRHLALAMASAMHGVALAPACAAPSQLCAVQAHSAHSSSEQRLSASHSYRSSSTAIGSPVR